MKAKNSPLKVRIKMTKLKISFMALCIGFVCLGQGARIDASVNNVPTAFDSSDAGSCIITCRAVHRIVVQNEISEKLAIGICDSCSTTPSEDFDYIPAGTKAGAVFNPVGDAKQVAGRNSLICFRVLDGSSASSGTLDVSCR